MTVEGALMLVFSWLASSLAIDLTRAFASVLVWLLRLSRRLDEEARLFVHYRDGYRAALDRENEMQDRLDDAGDALLCVGEWLVRGDVLAAHQECDRAYYELCGGSLPALPAQRRAA